jgi:hypothetical protein
VGPGFVPEESPPPDAAADPERLAFWRQQQEARTQATFGGCEWFEASGCGQHEILCCEHPTGEHGEVFTSSAVCTPKSAPVPNREPGPPISLGEAVIRIRRGAATGATPSAPPASAPAAPTAGPGPTAPVPSAQ